MMYFFFTIAVVLTQTYLKSRLLIKATDCDPFLSSHACLDTRRNRKLRSDTGKVFDLFFYYQNNYQVKP